MANATELLNDILELLARAYKYDDKPHLVFTQIAALAQKYEPDEYSRREIVWLMDRAAKIPATSMDYVIHMLGLLPLALSVTSYYTRIAPLESGRSLLQLHVRFGTDKMRPIGAGWACKDRHEATEASDFFMSTMATRFPLREEQV